MRKSETGDFGDVLPRGDRRSGRVEMLGGKVRGPRIPVAWVEIGKAYVSYHRGIAVPTKASFIS